MSVKIGGYDIPPKQEYIPMHGQFKGTLKYRRGQKNSSRRDLKTTQLILEAKILNSSHLEVEEGDVQG